MRLLSRCVVIAAATLAIGGCSHGALTELPTAPTPGAPVIRSLTISPVGGGTLIAGQSVPIITSGPMPSSGVPLGAFAQYSDGSARFVEATWTTSDATVLIVSNQSFVAVGRGTATLTATAEGRSASENYRIDPGIPGTWAGAYVVEQCEAGSSLMYELICSAVPGRPRGALPVGATAPIAFEISQSGTDLTATAAFGDIRGRLTGSDRGRNFLTLSGDLTGGTTTISVVYWDAAVKMDVMDAFIGFQVRMAGVPSYAVVSGYFVDVTRR